MESDNVDMGISGGSSGSVSSRWNPTKEQISLLESLYKQGIRTPSADQIQQITGRLKAYGHIEGKNVFYWFQNHKARQRQKLKQESMALNRYLHSNAHYQPAFAPSCPNVVCSPYYLQQQSDLGFYQHYSNALLSGGFKRRARAEKMDNKTISCFCTAYEPHVSNEGNYFNMHKMRDSCDQEALPLFPLHPTGFLQHGKETTISYSDLTSAENSTNSSSSFDPVAGVEDGSCYKPFFDFFSGRAPSKS